MKIEIHKLGSEITDLGTQVQGTITHFELNTDGHQYYLFQPKGSNPETGGPINRMYITKSRIKDRENVPTEEREIHVDESVLMSQVTDLASGITGTCTGVMVHQDGCVHLVIQPPGLIKTTNCPKLPLDASILRCKGEKVPSFSEAAAAEVKTRTPSPAGFTGAISRHH